MNPGDGFSGCEYSDPNVPDGGHSLKAASIVIDCNR